MHVIFSSTYFSMIKGLWHNANTSYIFVAGFGTLISRVIRMVIITYGWRGSLIILAAICIQCLVCAALIRPLYARKVPAKPGFTAVEEILSKKDKAETKETATPQTDPEQNKQFSSHDGIFRSARKASLVPSAKRYFSSHMQIGQVISATNHDSALRHRSGDVKLNPYARDDVFFTGSTYDIAQMKAKRGDVNADKFASQITIDSIPVDEKGCTKIKSNLRKNFNLKIFKSLTFCLVVCAMTLHHMAFFVPYTYVISLARDNGIPQSKSEYLIICFGKFLST